jgi:hypothetical protein
VDEKSASDENSDSPNWTRRPSPSRTALPRRDEGKQSERVASAREAIVATDLLALVQKYVALTGGRRARPEALRQSR